MLKLTVVTPEKKLITDLQVQEVFVPGEKGELNILPGHAPLITTLSTGTLKYPEANGTNQKVIAISWGYCEIFNDHVNILAETAEGPEEINTERAQAAMKRAMEVLEKGDYEYENMRKYQAKLERAVIRMNVATAKSESGTQH